MSASGDFLKARLQHHVSGAIARGEAVAIVAVDPAPAGWISEPAALSILTGKGEFSEGQALIVLGHSLQRLCNGLTHYPRAYIEKRATDHANKPEPNAWDCR